LLIYTYIHTRLSIYIYIYVCMCEWIYMCINVRIYMCTCVNIYLYICICIYIHAHTHPHLLRRETKSDWHCSLHEVVHSCEKWPLMPQTVPHCACMKQQDRRGKSKRDNRKLAPHVLPPVATTYWPPVVYVQWVCTFEVGRCVIMKEYNWFSEVFFDFWISWLALMFNLFFWFSKRELPCSNFRRFFV